MAWSFSSKRVEHFVQGARMTAEIAVNEFADIVTEAVKARKEARGLKAAIHDTARLLGLTERRVRACIYREIRSVTAGEWLRVRARFAAHLEAEQRRHIAEAELLSARLDALKKEAA